MISDLYLGTSRRTRALQHSALVVIPPQPAMSLTRDLPIRSVGFPPTKAVHPPASQHGVFIPFAPFGFLIAEVFTTENTEARRMRSRKICGRHGRRYRRTHRHSPLDSARG
jgi:hypothetical protein